MQRQKCKKVGLHFKRRALTALLFVYFPLEWAMNDEVKNTSSMMMMQRTMAILEWDSRESHAYLLFKAASPKQNHLVITFIGSAVEVFLLK